MRNRQRGFTMVELVVTMIIIGIMAIAVVPRMDLLRGFDEIGFRDQARATLQYARKAAVAQRRNICVTITATDISVTRDIRDPDSNAADCTHVPTPGINRVTLPGTNTNTITAPAGMTLTAGAFTFTPLGASSGGTLSIPSAGTITVEAETGYVH